MNASDKKNAAIAPILRSVAAVFVASDSLLAFRLFTPLFQTPPEDTLIMGLYLAAQLCIALGVLRTAVPRAPRAPHPSETPSAA